MEILIYKKQNSILYINVDDIFTFTFPQGFYVKNISKANLIKFSEDIYCNIIRDSLITKN